MYRSFFISLLTFSCFAQTFAPNPGEPGSTAIHKDSSVFISWADNVSIQPGWKQISDTTQGRASYGLSAYALGKAEGDGLTVVSLGDGGEAIYYLSKAIKNGPGPDFAVFENGFANNYLELAFVEVSNDGISYFRFPAYSETPTNTQSSNASYTDTRYVHNLAGKYRQGYGTPFDLSDLDSIAELDLDHIHFVRIIDVIGSIDANYASYDSQGRIINDPWPTNFESGGFDLDALGIIYQQEEVGLESRSLSTLAYTNPCNEKFDIQIDDTYRFQWLNMQGMLLKQGELRPNLSSIPTGDLPAGYYYLLLESENGEFIRLKIQKQ